MEKKRMGIEKTPIPINFIDWEGGRYQGNYMSPYRLMWEVPYQAGELKVVAYEDDLAVSKKIINTASEPIRIELTADRDKLLADGKDISFISVRVVDKDGNLCPRADNLIEFDVSELGIIEAVGNGDPATTAPFKSNQRRAFNGMCMLIVKTTKNMGEINITAQSKGLESAKITLYTNRI